MLFALPYGIHLVVDLGQGLVAQRLVQVEDGHSPAPVASSG